MKIRMEAVNCQVHAASTSHHDGQKYDPHNPMNHKDISPHSAGRHLFREQILHGIGDDGRRHRRSKKKRRRKRRKRRRRRRRKKSRRPKTEPISVRVCVVLWRTDKGDKKRGGRESIDVALSVWWEPTGRLFFNYRVGKGRPKKNESWMRSGRTIGANRGISSFDSSRMSIPSRRVYPSTGSQGKNKWKRKRKKNPKNQNNGGKPDRGFTNSETVQNNTHECIQLEVPAN